MGPAVVVLAMRAVRSEYFLFDVNILVMFDVVLSVGPVLLDVRNSLEAPLAQLEKSPEAAHGSLAGCTIFTASVVVAESCSPISSSSCAKRSCVTASGDQLRVLRSGGPRQLPDHSTSQPRLIPRLQIVWLLLTTSLSFDVKMAHSSHDHDSIIQ